MALNVITGKILISIRKKARDIFTCETRWKVLVMLPIYQA
jgi:hypothetical protein